MTSAFAACGWLIARSLLPRPAPQELNVKLGFRLTAAEMGLLVEKFVHEDYPDMVNFLAFANTVDDEEAMYYDNY